MTNLALIGTSIALIAATACWYFMPLRTSEPAGRHRISSPPDRMEACKLLCDAPAQQFSVPQAHAAMQIHRECTTASCARKADAYWTLVDAGKIKTGKAVAR